MLDNDTTSGMSIPNPNITMTTTTITTTTTATYYNTATSSPTPSAKFFIHYYSALSLDGKQKYDFHHQLPGEPSHETVVAILCLSVTVLVSSSFVLIATRYTSGGQSGTLVFLRSLLLSDILMALYGLTKMLFLLFLRQLRVHFFLPDSLFFTASLASSSSLLSLNLDCFLKLAKPFQYAQVEKHTVISFMLLMWNAAFVVGFLPLVGWHDEAYTFRFFSFYPWHFLLFNGLVIFVCVIICIVCMVSLKKFYILPEADPSCFSVHTLEIRKYRHLHRTIVIESAMWLASYLPFFIYISLTCRQCFHSDYAYKDSTIIYFLPVFLGKSLFSAFLQAFRTFHVHTVMNKIITDLSHHTTNHNSNHHHQQQHHHSSTNNNNDTSVSTIAYTNPLSEHPEHGIYPINAGTAKMHYRELLNLNHHRNNDISSNHNHNHVYKRRNHHNNHQHHQCCHHHPHHRHNNHHQDHYTFYPYDLDNGVDDILHQQELTDNFLLNADNWTLHPHHHHHDGLTDDEDDDDGGMLTSARLEIHGSDENIVGIANLGFRPSIDLETQQLSTKL